MKYEYVKVHGVLMATEDYRRIGLTLAQREASKALIAMRLYIASLILFPLAVIALAIDSFWCGWNNRPWQEFGSWLMALATIWIGKRVICVLMDISAEHMQKRQELVDEVAATMRACE